MFDIWHDKGQDTYLCYHQFPRVYLCSLSHNLVHKKNLTFHESVLLHTLKVGLHMQIT